MWESLSGGNHQLMLDEFFYYYRPHHISSSKGTYHFSVKEKNLKLVSDMPDSNRNWKSRYFIVEGTNWVCHEEEWATMPRGYFDNTWAFVRELGWTRQLLFCLFYSDASNTVYFFLIVASARPHITDEQEEFIQRVLEIPLDQIKCQNLINLDTIHLYCGGPEPSLEAWKLGEDSRRRK